MREIEFRAWLKKDKKMVEVKSIHFGTKKIIYGYSENSHSYGNVSCKFDDCELMQYTGLKDKNGTKIFEGDIVKLVENNHKYEWTAIVEFGNPNGYYTWGWQLNPITKNVECNLDILCWIDMDDVGVSCEVIGNIHDNPELLQA